MTAAASPEHRLLELLADQATVGLGDAERAELQAALAERPDVDAEATEIAAVAVHLALLGPVDTAVPETLRGRLLASADAFVHARMQADGSPTQAATVPARRLFLSFRALGWYAAAAAVLLAIAAWWPRPSSVPPGQPTLAEERTSLIETAPDVVRVAWQPLAEDRFAGVAGDVVWSTRRQTGYMRLRGLPAKNPTRQQYQLWIVDPRRDEKHPVDGGVFDVATADAETIIPIRAKLAINEPKVFALTLEQPGGVVVSKGPLLVVAKVQ